MIPIQIACPRCGAERRYEPGEYVGEFLLCKGCGRMVPIEDFYPLASREARVEMWRQPIMQTYLRAAGLEELRPPK